MPDACFVFFVLFLGALGALNQRPKLWVRKCQEIHFWYCQKCPLCIFISVENSSNHRLTAKN